MSPFAFLLVTATYVLARSRRRNSSAISGGAAEAWEVTLYQKLDFSVDEVVRGLTSTNVIGTGSSSVVYRVELPNGEPLAVKKMWSSDEAGAFRNEISALGSIRHRNIIRLLGWGANRRTKLLFYTYLPNGSLSGFLHCGGVKEYASMQRITEKSDVYSFEVVVLEILTGRHPLDPTLPGGTHLVQWVREHMQAKRGVAELLDPRLRGKPETQVQEMLQVFAIAMLCISHRAYDRPAMKDVVALLKEVRWPPESAGDEGKE